MLTRKLPLTMICLSAALYPAISSAWPGQRSLNACVNAFEETLATPAPGTHSYKVIFRGDRFSNSVLEPLYSRDFSFDLRANDPKTGNAVAHVRCEANRVGVVTAFTPIPVQSNRETTARASADGARISAY
jgi:hypothetical protein